MHRLAILTLSLAGMLALAACAPQPAPPVAAQPSRAPLPTGSTGGY